MTMYDNADSSLVEVKCWSCGRVHLNDPDLSLPMCEDCLDDYYQEEEYDY